MNNEIAKSQMLGNEELIERVEFVDEADIGEGDGVIVVADGRTPTVIAAEINVIKERTAGVINALGETIRSGVYEIGKLLCEAKEKVPHGQWGEWLENNVAYSDSTAQNLMKIYRELSDGQVDMLTGKTQAELFAGLEYSQMIEVLKLPKADRARLAEENDLAGMSSREIKELVKKARGLEEQNAALLKENADKNGVIEDLTAAKNTAELQVASLKGDVTKSEKALKAAEKEKKKAIDEATKALLAEIDELKNATPEAGEGDIERIKAEAIAEIEEKHKAELSQMSLLADERAKKLQEEADAEVARRIEEYKAKMALANDDTVKVVGVYIEQLSDALNKISERVASAPDEVKEKLTAAVKALLAKAGEAL